MRYDIEQARFTRAIVLPDGAGFVQVVRRDARRSIVLDTDTRLLEIRTDGALALVPAEGLMVALPAAAPVVERKKAANG